MDELRRYELYVIFQPELDEGELESRIERTDGYLTNSGGEIVEIVRRGKRRLQYSIKRHNQGIDVIYQANLPASALETLERQLNLNEDVLRYLIVRRDEEETRLVASEEELATVVANLQAQPTELELSAEEGAEADEGAQAADEAEGEQDEASASAEAALPADEEETEQSEGSAVSGDDDEGEI